MPGYLLHVGATMQCPHGGQATVPTMQTRVMVSNQAVAPFNSVITVAGCAFMVGTKPQPCATVKWLMPTSRVMIMGQPAAVIANPGPGPAICQSADQIPAGPPIVSSVQVRVNAM
ncbi:hypothetical protein [Granulicella arctica]|uniref:hypothetical protein n=1 Tax=Granulicella arctica TaxID=940613 RepID=UPI0021E0399F|nr:hypothetical protein [Granulicella arctica]